MTDNHRPYNSRAVALSPLMICCRNSTEASGCTATKYIRPKCCVTSGWMLGPDSWALMYPSSSVQRCILPIFVRSIRCRRLVNYCRNRKIPALDHHKKTRPASYIQPIKTAGLAAQIRKMPILLQ